MTNYPCAGQQPLGGRPEDHVLLLYLRGREGLPQLERPASDCVRGTCFTSINANPEKQT